MFRPDKIITTDVVVVGSGLAGLLTALTVAEKKQVLLISKTRLDDGATVRAQGGIAAVLDQTHDRFADHITDTMKAGAYHNDRSIVRYVVEQAPRAIEKLQEYGVRFDRGAAREGGHGTARIIHVKDHTGKNIEMALIRAVRRHRNITIWEHATALDLIVEKAACTGIAVIKDKKIVVVHAEAVVLATGGVGHLFKHTTNPKVAVGTGIAMAHRAGAALKDLEFIQFHPTALADRTNPHMLLSEALRGAGAHLINRDGQRFTLAHNPRGELATRDLLTRLIYQEQTKNSKTKNSVYLDMTHLDPQKTKRNFPTIYRAIRQRLKKDLTKEPIPITPAAHYLCGGIAVNRHGETTIKNLYAVGETSCTGLHGANRLASNSLLEAAVFALAAGAHIAQLHIAQLQTSQTHRTQNKSPSLPYRYDKKHDNLAALIKEIQTIMWNNVGIVRTKNQLQQAIKQLRARKPLLGPANIMNEQRTEAHAMLTTAILITEAALRRTTSRTGKKSLGCHWIAAPRRTRIYASKPRP